MAKEFMTLWRKMQIYAAIVGVSLIIMATLPNHELLGLALGVGGILGYFMTPAYYGTKTDALDV